LDLFPAIDIRAGQVARASRDAALPVHVYHPDPFAVAEGYLQAGARWVHVVDLDRAYGLGDQTALVSALVKRLPIPVQVGGGLAGVEEIERMRDLGVQRVVLGSRAAADVRGLTELTDQFAEASLALAVDIRDGVIWVRDGSPPAGERPLELARRAHAGGITTLVVTDLSREGALAGANVGQAEALAREAGVEVIVSGGIAQLDDLRRLRDAGLAGAVVGRALYEKRFTLEEALACCSS
jgi:phosphoribosylformimino-5-aminoimidazole carboxamide ribotide isomerase